MTDLVHFEQLRLISLIKNSYKDGPLGKDQNYEILHFWDKNGYFYFGNSRIYRQNRCLNKSVVIRPNIYCVKISQLDIEKLG